MVWRPTLRSGRAFPVPKETVGCYQSRSSTAKGHDSPGSNWALHHAKSNLPNAVSKLSEQPAMLRSPGYGGSGSDIFSDLEKLIVRVLDKFKKAIQQIKTDIIDQLSELPATQIVIKLSGIVGDLVVGIAQELVSGVFKIAKDAITDLVSILTTDLHIPILSPIYSWLTETKENPKGERFSRPGMPDRSDSSHHYL